MMAMATANTVSGAFLVVHCSGFGAMRGASEYYLLYYEV